MKAFHVLALMLVGVLQSTAAVSAPATGILIGRLAEGTAYQRLMSVPVLYKDAQSPWVQQLAFIGQLQVQYASGSSASGNFSTADLPDLATWETVEVRRFRLGMKAILLRKLFFINLMDLEPDPASGL